MHHDTNLPKDAVMSPTPENLLPTYRSKSGALVALSVTKHALQRVHQRTSLLRTPGMEGLSPVHKVTTLFTSAVRVQSLNTREKHRLEKHGKDTMFFRNGDFTFVVQNCTIVTVEISRSYLRHLNRGKVLF